jgi:hypothetical protein
MLGRAIRGPAVRQRRVKVRLMRYAIVLKMFSTFWIKLANRLTDEYTCLFTCWRLLDSHRPLAPVLLCLLPSLFSRISPLLYWRYLASFVHEYLSSLPRPGLFITRVGLIRTGVGVTRTCCFLLSQVVACMPLAAYPLYSLSVLPRSVGFVSGLLSSVSLPFSAHAAIHNTCCIVDVNICPCIVCDP